MGMSPKHDQRSRDDDDMDKGDANDTDDDDDDDDIFEESASNRHKRKQKRKRVTPTARTLAAGSEWEAKEGGAWYEDVKVEFIKNSNTKYPELGPTHRIVKSGGTKNGLHIGCCTDNVLPRTKAKCTFHVTGHDKGKGNKSMGRITSICLDHNCDVLIRKVRIHNTYTKHMGKNWTDHATAQTNRTHRLVRQ